MRIAVLSVLSQPCKDLIVIIVNDGSTDCSLQIAKDIATADNRVHVISQENQGVSVARNRGIAEALSLKVKYIAFLDGDDVWVNGFYTDELNDIVATHDMDAYRYPYINGNQNLTRGKLNEVFPSVETAPEIDLYGGPFSSYFYKAEKINEYALRFLPHVMQQEDVVFRYLFLSFCKTLENRAETIFAYRSNNYSVTHQRIDIGNKYFGNVIYAWQHTKEEIQRIASALGVEKDREIAGCATMQKAMLAEYIEMASGAGCRPKQIQKCMNQSNLKYLYNDSEIWIDDVHLKLWNDFWRHPYRVYFRYRIKYLLFNTMRRFFRNSGIFQKKRYPENIADMVAQESGMN